MKLNYKALLLLSSLTLAAEANAATAITAISYNWDYFGTIPSNSTSFAGVVSVAHWNNSWPGTNTPPTSVAPTVNLKDNAGSTTTMDVFFSGTAQWQLNPLNTPPAVDGDGTYNKRLLKGYVDMVGGNPVSVTLSQIPYSNYDVYIYMSSDTANREGWVSDDGGATYFFRTVGSAAITGSNATLQQATDTTDLATNGLATYARFSNLTGNSQVFSVFAAGNAGIAGFQVVQIPEPSAALLGGLGFLALLRRRR